MGGSFERRTPAEMAAIPMRHDVTAAAVAAACSSTAVAPFLMCVDRAVVAAAAGTAPGGSLFRAIAGVAGEFVTKPKTAFAQPALWMVAGVYGGTYLAKNVSDVCIERRGLSESHKGANAAKFAATTACNMGGSILKDAAFAKLYGSAVAAVVLVSPASYALFAARDCLTIGGAFVVPDALAAGLTRATGASRETAATVSQLVSPPLMQVLCTPMHLLSLSLINEPSATAAARIAKLKLATPAALLARSLRMLPAYGVGGILNTTLVARGRGMARAHALPTGGGGPAAPPGFRGTAERGERRGRRTSDSQKKKKTRVSRAMTKTSRGRRSRAVDSSGEASFRVTLAGGWRGSRSPRACAARRGSAAQRSARRAGGARRRRSARRSRTRAPCASRRPGSRRSRSAAATATRRRGARRRRKQPAPKRRVGVSANGSARGCGAEGTRRESKGGWDKDSPLDGDAGGCGGRGGPPAPPPARDDERVDSSLIFCCVVATHHRSPDRSFSNVPNGRDAAKCRARRRFAVDFAFRVLTVKCRVSSVPRAHAFFSARSNAVARGRPRRAATRVRGRRPLVSRLVASHEA